MSAGLGNKYNSNHRKNSQSAVDYLVFLTIIVATLVVMGYYIRNSLAQKHREAADAFGTGEVYSPNIPGVTNPTHVHLSPTPPPGVVSAPSRDYMW